MNHPLLLLVLTGAGVWLFKLWRDDVRAAQTGRPNPNAFPGAAPAPLRASVIAVDSDLEPDLVALLIGIGVPLSLLTAWGWWALIGAL